MTGNQGSSVTRLRHIDRVAPTPTSTSTSTSIGCTLSPKKEVGVGEEESSGIGEVEVVVREMYTGHAPVYISRNK